MARITATLSLLLAVCLGLVTASGYQRTVSYADQVLVRCDRNGKGVDEFLASDDVDVWQISFEHAEVRVLRDLFHSKTNLDCTVIANVEDLVSRAENRTFRANPDAEWFQEYHNYDEIVNWYQDLATNNPKLVRFVSSIGSKTQDGHDQQAVHITAADNSAYRVFFQCQIHAREWISGAVCMYFANRLVEDYEKDERVNSLLKEVEFVIVPFANPDGYVYTWTNNRLWRKSRSLPPSGSNCRGVDLNRNFPFHWNEGGSSSNPCSDTYMGTRAGSEIETQNIIRYFESQLPIITAIDWHSYSQLILRPPGWTKNTDDVPENERFAELGRVMSNDIKGVHGKSYTSQIAADLYIASGGAEDWFYSVEKSPAFTIELRPKDSSGGGFMLPANQIIPNGEEVYPAVLKLVEAELPPERGL